MKIGVFDSGVGGLTVLRVLRNCYPKLDLIYFGDTARVPYGNKSVKSIKQYSVENAQFLLEKGAEAIVIACNTSAAVAEVLLREKFSVPIFGVIDPGIDAVLKTTKINKIAVLGTHRTISSHVYSEKIKQKNKNITVYEKACPLLVPIIEEGLPNEKILLSVVRQYLDDLSEVVDVFLLGCTHYPLIKSFIEKTYAEKNISVVDSASSLAEDLPKHISCSEGNGATEIYTSDLNEVFQSIFSQLFPKEKAILTEIASAKNTTAKNKKG